MFKRIISLIGENNFNIIKNLNIVIVGIGGVGGYVFESLIRSGIQNITIIDNDNIDISNLNRQIITNYSNIGENKTSEAKKRGLSINPSANITTYNIFLDKNNMNILNEIKIDYIIDCCDSIDTKFEIIKYCTTNNIKFITCLGTAKKLHPELLSITTLDKTSYDPLARILRKKVSNAKIRKKIPVVSSTEKIKENYNKELGSMAFVPNAAGILLSSYVINDCINLDY